ncbi:hypothetical protein [Stomatobaculum longum]|nr:hypothetical protein [Stomatobaculum longum]
MSEKRTEKLRLYFTATKNSAGMPLEVAHIDKNAQTSGTNPWNGGLL